MNTEKRDIHIHGVVQGLVIGDYNTITLVYQSGEQRTVPFLAPPQPPYKLVGRDDLLRDLKGRLFAQQQVALSALNGLPGVGKTALAVALAYDLEVLGHFSNGVLWAGLGRKASETDALSYLGSWGTALGISSGELEKQPDLSSRRMRIQAAIGQRRMLLVVDDAWQVEVARHFNIGGPNCAFLVTTRLPIVAADLASDGMMVVHELNEDDGLILLRELAPQVVDAEPHGARALVQAVGGLPLALTLMGRYLRKQASGGQPRRVLEALDRLCQVEERLKLDEPQVELGYHPDLPESIPVSLHAVIAISDEALDEPSHKTLLALSAFPPKPNTFSEEAALAVSTMPAKTLDKLSDYGLLESSGPGRYTLHQTIADYAKAKRTDRACETRMAEYFASYVEQHEMDYELLEQETTNVHEALHIAIDQGMQPVLLRGANAFSSFLWTHGLYAQAEDYLTRAQEAARSLDEHVNLVTVLLNQGRVALKWGDYAQAEAYMQEGLTLARQLGHRVYISALLQNLGEVAAKQGDNTQAEAYWQEGLTLARQLRHAILISALLDSLGAVAGKRGDYVQAETYYQEGLELARQLGHREIISTIICGQAEIDLKLGRLDTAWAEFREVLEMAPKGHQELVARAQYGQAKIAAAQGKYDEARQLGEASLTIFKQMGHSMASEVRQWFALLSAAGHDTES